MTPHPRVWLPALSQRPKLTLFFLAILPRFTGHASNTTAQMALLGAVNVCTEFVLYGGIGVLAGTSINASPASPKASATLNYLAATVYAALACIIIVSAPRTCRIAACPPMPSKSGNTSTSRRIGDTAAMGGMGFLLPARVTGQVCAPPALAVELDAQARRLAQRLHGRISGEVAPGLMTSLRSEVIRRGSCGCPDDD